MAHQSRSRRRANERRREAAALKQKPLPLAEQRARCAERQALHATRYPHPPAYSDSWGRKARTQPACYDLGPAVGNPFGEFLTRLMFASMRRAGRESLNKKTQGRKAA